MNNYIYKRIKKKPVSNKSHGTFVVLSTIWILVAFVWLMSMIARPVEAGVYKAPVKYSGQLDMLAVETYEIIGEDASHESRIYNLAVYCGTDGAKEEFGSSEHCNEYYLLILTE